MTTIKTGPSRNRKRTWELAEGETPFVCDICHHVLRDGEAAHEFGTVAMHRQCAAEALTRFEKATA